MTIDSPCDQIAFHRVHAEQLRRQAIDAAIDGVLLWIRRWSGRRDLARLSEREIKDIGLTPCEARRECRKPFWRE